jgi:ABC-type nitrate/sulfonate/bicarbonate transport system permease component
MARLEDDARALQGATPVAAERAEPGFMAAAGWFLARWIVIIVLLAGWEIFARSGAVTPFMLPALSVVLGRIWEDAQSGELLINAGQTLYRALVGFVIAGVGGILLGMLMARSRGVRWFFDPIISVGFPMPKIAFLPIIVLWLGFFDVSKITMIAFNTIFPVITATIVGIYSVEKEIVWSARNLGTGEHEMLWEIIFPAALPQIFTGLQVALPIAMIVGVLTEMAMGGYGVGGSMQTATRMADSLGVFAGIVEIAVVGYALVKFMTLLRRRLLVWHQEASEPTTV